MNTIPFPDVTLLYDSDKTITMAKYSFLLERAWQQLELENPESIRRLRELKAEQEKVDRHRVKTGVLLTANISSYNHVSNIFKDLTNPQFASNFGNVTLVFKNGECVRFYKSLLSLISVDWRMLLQMCNESDLVILTGLSQKDFFEEVVEEKTIFRKPNTEELVEEKIHCDGEIKDEDLFGKASTSVEEVRNYSDDNSKIKRMPSKSHLRSKKRWCHLCEKIIAGATHSRHMAERHTQGRGPVFPCTNCDSNFTRNQALKKHKCRK